MKTFQEFITEAKKCWPGYKKKGTQKLFGKTYNRCVKEEVEIEEDWSNEYKKSIDCSNPKGFSQKAHCAARKKRAAGGETKSKSPFKEMYEIDEHCGCEDSAVKELESGLRKLKNTSYNSIDKLMRPIMKKHDMTAKQLHNAFVDKHDKTPDDWIDNLNESSTGERTKGRATLARGRGADMTRDDRTTASVAKKAGLKGTGKYSTKDLRKPARDYTTYDSEDTEDDVGSTEQDHFIRTYSSARRAAKGERLISKMKPSGKRTPSGMTRLKTAPSSESVRRVKDLRKQMTKSGASKTGRVHTVDIMHRDSDVGKGDRNQQMERGRNFIQAVKDTGKHLKKAGAKPGETVLGKPTAVMPGEDKKTGEAKRAKLYGKIFGKKSTKASPKTGLMTGRT